MFLPLPLEDAMARSAQEAIERGCARAPDDGTRYWWGWETNGVDACLWIPPGDEGTLTEEERQLLTPTPPAWLTELRAAHRQE